MAGGEETKLAFTTTTSPIDNKGDGRDFGWKEPTNGMLPTSPRRREVFGLLDIFYGVAITETCSTLVAG